MKIINQTTREILISSPEKIVSNNFWNLSGVLSGMALAGIYTFVPISIGLESISGIGVTKIMCDRVEPQQVDCKVSKSKFFDLIREEPVSIKSVRSAEHNAIEGHSDEVWTIDKYNFQFINKFGEVKTFDDHQESAHKTTESVNSFLASQQTSLKYTTDDRTNYKLIITLVFKILFCLYVLFIFFKTWLLILQTYSDKEIILNKPQCSFNYVQTRYILGKKIDSYKFTDVARIDVLYSTDSYENVSFTPRITMRSGREYILDKVSDRQAVISLANNLNQFMGLPEEEDPVVRQ